MSSSNNAPLPDAGREPDALEPARPQPVAVPPAESARRNPARWLIPLLVILIAAGVAYYLKVRAAKNAATASVISTPVVTVSAGDVARTIRVTGTVAARNFAALMA